MATLIATRGSDTLTVEIPDIHCWECAWILQLALEAFDGVEDADVDWQTHVATISYRPTEVSRRRLVEVMEAAGHEVVERISLPVTDYQEMSRGA